MTADYVETTTAEILAWARDHDQEFDRDVMAELFDMADVVLGRQQLADFQAGDLERLLLEVYPRSSCTPRSSTPSRWPPPRGCWSATSRTRTACRTR